MRAIFSRIVLSPWSIPGWIGAFYLILANVVTAQGVISALIDTQKWLRVHPGYIGAFSIVWFTGLATHDKWKAFVPKWMRIPRTPGERLDAIESHLGSHLGTKETFSRLHSTVDELVRKDLPLRLNNAEAKLDTFSQWLGPNPPIAFPQFCGMVDRSIEKSGNINQRLISAESGIQSYQHHIGDLSSDLAQLTHDVGINLDAIRGSLKDLEKESRQLASLLRDSIVPMEDIGSLALECLWSIDFLKDLRERYPLEAATKRPFSMPWWSADRSVRPPEPIVRWALLEKIRLEHCDHVVASLCLSGEDLVPGRIRRYHGWNCQDDMQDVIKELEKQLNLLRQKRNSYAASLAVDLPVSGNKL